MLTDIEKVIREYLPNILHMSLATCANNKPWVCEVHFVYDDNLNLYFRSLLSRRHSQEIAQNPNVAGNIVKQHSVGESGHGIYFEGLASLIIDPKERQSVFPLFNARLGSDESILKEAENETGHQFYKIVVKNWYAF